MRHASTLASATISPADAELVASLNWGVADVARPGELARIPDSPYLWAEVRHALLEGLRDGTIDFLVSNHIPWDEEAKNLEFPYAEFGMIGLETAFSLCCNFGQLPLPLLVEKMSLAPRRILGIPVPEIKVGEMAELTVFDPTLSWTVTPDSLGSKSRNTPFMGRTLQGKVLTTIISA